VQVVRQGQEPRVVDEMGEGSLFGEIALLADVPRVASVVARTESMLLEVTRGLLNELAARHKALPAVLDRFYKERLLANLLRSNDLFASFSRPALARLVERFQLRQSARGEELVKQGEIGRGFFVVLRGRCVAYDEPSGHEYPEMSEGSVFGEIALLELCAATATVRAETACVLLFLDRDAFADEVLGNNAAAKQLESIARERLDRSQKALGKMPAALI
jgi:CRP-like cAMP-binding protein